MQIVLNVSDLLDGLNTVTRALSARPVKQILEGVLIEAQDDAVTLTCSDGSLTIERTLAADVKENGRAVLPGKLFTELARKLPGGQVSINVSDNRTASIRCMSSRSNLSVMNAIEYPEIAGVDRGATIDLPQNRLRGMISRVVFAIATDESRQILTGCLMEITPEEGRIVALDGFRLAIQRIRKHFDLPDDTDLLRFVVPGRVMNELSKILPDDETPCTLTMNKTHLQVVFGSTKMTTVLLAGEYIDYNKIIPPSFRTTSTTNRMSMLNAIDRASLMAREGKNNLIRMSFREDSLSITSNAEMGDVHEEMDSVLDGDSLDIAFNAKYITDIIRNIDDDQLCMCFNSNISPCVVRPQEGDDFIYLILPVRVFQ